MILDMDYERERNRLIRIAFTDNQLLLDILSSKSQLLAVQTESDLINYNYLMQQTRKELGAWKAEIHLIALAINNRTANEGVIKTLSGLANFRIFIMECLKAYTANGLIGCDADTVSNASHLLAGASIVQLMAISDFSQLLRMQMCSPTPTDSNNSNKSEWDDDDNLN
jgi:hypothetical protein